MSLLLSFASQHFALQLLILLGCSVGIILAFGFILQSLRDSLHLFVDSGALTQIPNSRKVLVGLTETFLGIMLIGAITSTITSAIMRQTEQNRLRAVHSTIKEAFDGHSLLATRKLLSKLNLSARLRYLDISEAEIRLELAREDMVKTIQSFGSLRLRWLRDSGRAVIEDFLANRSYGCFIDRHSPITVIATQNYSDAGIGHFAATLSNSVGANYISNELYSIGAPLKSHQLNFSSNPAFSSFALPRENGPLRDFLKDLRQLAPNTKIFIYISSASSEHAHDVHLLYGGEAGSLPTVQSPTVSKMETWQDFKKFLEARVSQLSLKLATHEDIGNEDPLHLTQAIHHHFGTDVLSLHISTRILWSSNDHEYYELLAAIRDSVREGLSK